MFIVVAKLASECFTVDLDLEQWLNYWPAKAAMIQEPPMTDSIQKEKGEIEEQIFAVGYCDINEQSYMKLEDAVAVSRFADQRIAEQQSQIEKLRQFVKDTAEDFECLPSCDSFGHDDLCPATNPVEGWRQLRETIAEQQRVIEQLKQAVIDLSKHIDPLGITDPCEKTLQTVRKLLGENNDK